MCSLWRKHSVHVTADCYKLFLITATHYSCHKQRKNRLDETKKHPHYFSQGHTNPTCKVNPSCSLFNSLRRRINKRPCANAFHWANLPASLAGSTLTTAWEKQREMFNKKMKFQKMQKKQNKPDLRCCWPCTGSCWLWTVQLRQG